MTWGKISRMYGLSQTLRRRYPPPKGKPIATEQTWKQAKKSHRAALKNQTAKGQSPNSSRTVDGGIFEKKKPRMIWPEERLMWEVFRRNPELKKIPYDLNSFEPPFAKRFALRQHELMLQGMSKEAAYRDTDKEMQVHKESLLKEASSVLPKYSVIATIQEQEEQELIAAYEEYQKLKG